MYCMLHLLLVKLQKTTETCASIRQPTTHAGKHCCTRMCTTMFTEGLHRGYNIPARAGDRRAASAVLYLAVLHCDMHTWHTRLAVNHYAVHHRLQHNGALSTFSLKKVILR